MAARRRLAVALIPTCAALETRLAPSGNFMSHGIADISRAVDHMESHHVRVHETAHHDAAAGAVKVRYDHIIESTSK